MGYSGATYLIQEVCNALFDALFHILPLGTEMDKVDATLARGISGAQENTPWDDAAQTRLHALVAGQPVLVQISAAKRLRDLAEGKARAKGEDLVTLDHVQQAGAELGLGETA
jgi:chlorophyllide a reductase subunit Z